jgi:hypothetical protein
VTAAPLAAGATATFLVGGVGQVPDGGVADAYVVINAISPQYSGCIDDYDADLSDPDICTTSFEAGQNATTSDIVQVSASGYVSVTNESGGPTDVSVTVMGYYQNGDMATNGDTAGDTYVPVSQTQIVDTRSGLGAPNAQIPAGGTLTVQVTGNGGVPANAVGAALYVGAANASSSGYVSAYPAGGTTSGLAILSYAANEKARDLYFGGLSSSGQLTLANNGSVPVDLMVGVQGYLLSSSASPAGDSYQDVPESRIVDTRNGTGGVAATPVPANGSITFAATGVDGVPTAGVPAVAESVAALSPTASGYLSIYPAGGTDPDNPGVNFASGDYQDNDMSTSVLSAVSQSGQETITNHSSGTVNVVVSVRGYYQAPTAPDAANSIVWSSSGSTTATVSWLAPYTDGGSPITSYTVTAPPDSASVTVGPGAFQATLTGLTDASADDFTVTATNAVGSGIPADMVTEPVGYSVSQTIGIQSDDDQGGGVSPQVSVAQDSASLTTTDANGTTTTTAVPAQTADMDIDSDPTGQGPTGETCDYKVNKYSGGIGNAIETLSSFNNVRTDSQSTVYWVNHLFAIPKARYRNGVLQYEAFACTTGGGDWFNSSGIGGSLSENALMANSANSNDLWDYYWPTITTGTQSVTATKGLSLGGQYQGANVTISASQSVTTVKNINEVTGSLGPDGHYDNWMPTYLDSYASTRVNTEWRADTQSGLAGPSQWIGSVGVAIWLFPQETDNDHTFYSVTLLGGCINNNFAECGNGNGNGNGKTTNAGS